jgi:hypothetical protein
LGSLQEHGPVSLEEKVLEKEEKELLEEEELEKLFLKNIYSKIMEEVMDLESDCDIILPREHKNKGRNIINIASRDETSFLE